MADQDVKAMDVETGEESGVDGSGPLTGGGASAELLQLAQQRFLLSCDSQLCPPEEKKAITQTVMDTIRKYKMAPFYKTVSKQFGWSIDNALVQQLEEENKTDIKEIESKIADAEENLGETEIREGLLSKAEYFWRIGDKESAISAFQATEEKTMALGQKLDIAFALIRLGFFWNDVQMIRKNIEKAQGLVDKVGDWERRNRLQVYEGVFCMMSREFQKAAQHFLDSLATFTSYEIFSYNTFIFYTVVTSMLALQRPTLRVKVVNAPEILSVLRDIPHLGTYLNSLYKCRYNEFYATLPLISDQVARDRYLGNHVRFYIRGMRVNVYTQFLESYKSVTLESMANAFGVSIQFMDSELSRFISAGKLNCKVDKVAGVVETNRPDAKNSQYQATIKQGDMLLNRIQKLSRVITY